jgi:enamine deaminase RidA (YjgF/YER057c/UK114 family)
MPIYDVVRVAGAPWPAHWTFSPAVRAGNLLFISGTTAVEHVDPRAALATPARLRQGRSTP